MKNRGVAKMDRAIANGHPAREFAKRRARTTSAAMDPTHSTGETAYSERFWMSPT